MYPLLSRLAFFCGVMATQVSRYGERPIVDGAADLSGGRGDKFGIGPG
jgi:hypothetical protein